MRATAARRVGLVLLLATALSLGLALVLDSADGGEPRGATVAEPFPHGITVVGDSITALYDDEPGSRDQGWWSFVGRHFDTEVETFAQSGSGYQRPGHSCTGDRFVDRKGAFEEPPSVFIVAGGRNDWASCREGVLVRSSDAAVATAVNRYFDLLQRELPSTTRIVVLGPPWGPAAPWEKRRITSIVHTAADRQGLEYVGTRGSMDVSGRTVDGVHPNRAGSQALGHLVIAALSKPAPAPS